MDSDIRVMWHGNGLIEARNGQDWIRFRGNEKFSFYFLLSILVSTSNFWGDISISGS